MTKKIIVANWKLNPETLREAKELFLPVKRAAVKLKNVETVICPPAVWLGGLALGSLKARPPLSLGAQNCFWELAGAYTGQLGPTMLRNAGATHVILGHSEARALPARNASQDSACVAGGGDTDQIVKAKLRLALKHGLKVILCVGERERDEHGKYLKILREQLESALAGLPRALAKQLILAYEPIWAIGAQAKGVDTPAAFLEQSIFLRKVLAGIVGKEAAFDCRILYGGSANADNAAGFLDEGKADGLLVGRASLDAEQFIKILTIADKIK